MAKDDEKKELWVDWTHDALGVYAKPDDIDDPDELIDDMADFASEYADAMLEEYDGRFSGGSGRRRRKKKPDDDDDDR